MPSQRTLNPPLQPHRRDTVERVQHDQYTNHYQDLARPILDPDTTLGQLPAAGADDTFSSFRPLASQYSAAREGQDTSHLSDVDFDKDGFELRPRNLDECV